MFLYRVCWQDLPLLSDKEVYGEGAVFFGGFSSFETTIAEMGMCICVCGESVFFI